MNIKNLASLDVFVSNMFHDSTVNWRLVEKLFKLQWQHIILCRGLNSYIISEKVAIIPEVSDTGSN